MERRFQSIQEAMDAAPETAKERSLASVLVRGTVSLRKTSGSVFRRVHNLWVTSAAWADPSKGA